MCIIIIYYNIYGLYIEMNIEYVLKICQSVNTEDVEKNNPQDDAKKGWNPGNYPLVI